MTTVESATGNPAGNGKTASGVKPGRRAPRARAAATSRNVKPVRAGRSTRAAPWIWVGAGLVAGALVGGALLRSGLLGRLGVLALAGGLLERLVESPLGERTRRFVARFPAGLGR